MSNTTKKHQSFVSEPMGNKPATAVPGIGRGLGQELQRDGVNKASQVFGHYLTGGQNPQQFGQWLKHSSGANSHQTANCTRAMKEYADNFMN
ncbi:barrier-to-autointegration factor-like protein [Pholidichthys leucotaenia]